MDLLSMVKWTQITSKWLENPDNVKAARFLSRGHNLLKDCTEELMLSNRNGIQTNSVERRSAIEMDSDSFNKALASVEEALNKLENIIEELHVSSSYSRKEQLKVACSDLEKIRKLKKEAEFLEASFRAKAASLYQEDDDSSESSISEQQQYWKGGDQKSVESMTDGGDRSVKKSRGFWSPLTQLPIRKSDAELTAVEKSEDEVIQQSSSIVVIPANLCSITAHPPKLGSKLLPGSHIEQLTLELLDAYGNHVVEGLEVQLKLDGFVVNGQVDSNHKHGSAAEEVKG